MRIITLSGVPRKTSQILKAAVVSRRHLMSHPVILMHNDG